MHPSPLILYQAAAGVLAFAILCWAVGAWRRMGRLRAAVIEFFCALAVQWQQTLAWIEEGQKQAEIAADASLLQAYAPLRNHTALVRTCLEDASRNPLDPTAISTLACACDALRGAWDTQFLPQAQRHEGLAHILASWGLQMRPLEDAKEIFNAAVRHYNEAVTQFPTRLLACACGFRTTICL